jgi:hypothetical protein
MKNINILIIIAVAISLIFLLSCDKESTEPEPPESHVSVSGDVDEAYEVEAFFGVSTYTITGPNPITKEYFSITLTPKVNTLNPLARTFLYKFEPDRAPVGTYQIEEYIFGQDIPANIYGGIFSSRYATDLSGYIMTDGLLTITESSDSKLAGEVEMSGYYISGLQQDTTRIVNVNVYFVADPATVP